MTSLGADQRTSSSSRDVLRQGVNRRVRDLVVTLSNPIRCVREGLLPAAIAGDSMLPLLGDGDWVVVRRTRRCRPGDVVAVRDPREPARIVVKRAIRQQGDGWWVQGDNAGASTDSRTFGAVAPELLVGRVVLRYWPRPRLFR